jgi:hypothetical protein
MLRAIVVCVVALGVKVQLAPEGNPEQLKVSVPPKPLSGLTVMLADPLCPARTVTVGALEEIVNGAVTVSGICIVLVAAFAPPLVAVMVIGALLVAVEAVVVMLNATVA